MEENIRYTVRRPKIDAAQLQRGLNGLPAAMRLMGYPSLRAGQDRVVSTIMAGRDCVVVLPTSTGKTAAMVLPVVALGQCLLIFSPLISLMQDQVQSLRQKGVRAGCLNSHNGSFNSEYLKDWVAGKLDVLIVAPERLRRDEFLAAMRHRRPWMVAVDEAHCLSAWSMTFRSAYCIVGDFITDFNPEVVVALTATCPPEVERDIRRVMCIEQALKVVHYPRRENLDLRSSDWPDMLGLHRAIADVRGPCIVYCATQKHTEEYAYQLGQLNGTEVGFYHGGLSPDKRSDTQRRFMQGDINVMCATNAFGMGVDKSDVRGVFHADFPGTIENYSQETGRGGRDGKYTLCMSYFSPGALNTQRFLINCSNPSASDVRSMFKTIARLAGSADTVHMSVDKIAQAARIKNINSSYACMQVLQGSLVVDRTKAEAKMCSVRFKNHLDDIKFADTKQAITALGDRQQDGYYSFDLLQLAVELDRNENGVRTYLNKLVKDSVIEFVPPERAAPTRIIGDDSLVDYDAVTRRRAEAEAKLDEVVHFLQNVPDGEKHGYLERYFGVTNEHTPA